MELTPEQESAVRTWADEGASLGDIQKRLGDEFELRLSYLDARFLLADLGVSLHDEEKETRRAELEQPAAPAGEPTGDAPGAASPSPGAGDSPVADASPAPPAAGAPPVDPGAGKAGEPATQDPADAATGDGGDVTVTVDAVAVPGTIVSGKVTFSDGGTGAWSLDQLGRLGFDPGKPGYQPPEADLMKFEQELQKALQKQGL